MPVSLSCARCGRLIKRKPSTVSRTNYCSWECRRCPIPPEDELRAAYEGATIADLSRHFGVDRSVAAGWLDKYGIPRRTVAEATRIWLSRVSYEDRLKMTAASRAKMAITGKKPHAGLVRRAQGIERVGKLSKPEQRVFDWVVANGYGAIPQKAVDKFNIDVAIPDLMVAIEVDGGLWHTRHSPEKLRGDEVKRAFLEPLGWKVFRIRGRNPGTLARDLEQLGEFLRHQTDAGRKK